MTLFEFSRPNRLWVFLSGFFVTNALVAEFMGVKLFSLEKTLGLSEVSWNFLGQENMSFTLTAGVLLWPMVFIMTDLINEYYGPKGVRMLSYLTAGLIAYGFFMLYFAMQLEPSAFWRTSHIQADWPEAKKSEMRGLVSDYNTAYSLVFGQSLWIIVGSLVAFLFAQIIDVAVFHRIKKWTGDSKLWLRATGSTMVSQFIDSFVVVFIALYFGLGYPFLLVLAISLMSYIYKAVIALAMTPFLYLAHHWIDQWLGKETAEHMKRSAQAQK
jgi:queuosine precursor transporter